MTNTTNNVIKNSATSLLAFLPLTLYFPVGVMYAGVVFFLLALIISGNYDQKWRAVKNHPLFTPILSLSLVSILIGLWQLASANSSADLNTNADTTEFWPSFFHYQAYLFLLLFISVGAGKWQQKAIDIFFAGAIIAASIFYVNAMGFLPHWKLFQSYQLYEGNKSILIGLLLAISSAWMLHEWRIKKNHGVIRALAFVYVISALILFANSRTALLLFLILSSLMVLRYCRWNWKLIPIVIAVCILFSGVAHYLNSQPEPVTCLTKEMRLQYQMNGTDVFFNRAVCTVHQIRDFKNHKAVSEDGMRLELFSNTLDMALEKPFMGHGIGTWLKFYKEKAKGSISAKMTTPHNDYLLYFFELGIIGPVVLLWILFSQLWLAKKMSQTNQYSQTTSVPRHHFADKAMLLSMMTIALLFSASLNAIFRDGLFSMAMMILLAIPLAGLHKKSLSAKHTKHE